MYGVDDANFRKQHDLPEREHLLNLDAEGAAKLLLRTFGMNRGSFVPRDTVRHFNVQAYRDDRETALVLMEGVAYLERYGLLVGEFHSYSSGDGRQLSRAAREAINFGTIDSLILATRDLRALFHPLIVAKALPDFDRGAENYESAVFKAFKRVEIAVREACGLGDDVLGVKLMQRAFGEGGPLRDSSEDPGEQQGLQFLFVGAIAVYKNPTSHRDVGMTEPARCIHALALASELLSIVELRSARLGEKLDGPR